MFGQRAGGASWPARLRATAFGAIAALCAVVAVAMAYFAWDMIRTLVSGRSGVMAVEHCRHTSSRGRDGWSCTGTFTGADGQRYGVVHAHVTGDGWPGPTMAGRISGPGSSTLWPAGGHEWIPAALLLLTMPVFAWLFARAALQELTPDFRTPLEPPRPPRPPRDRSQPSPPSLPLRLARRLPQRRRGRRPAAHEPPWTPPGSG